MPRLYEDTRTAPIPQVRRLVSLSEASRLYARARTALPSSPRFGTARGHRVFWLERDALRFRDVVADEGGFAILGRHSRTHVRLTGDPTVALRHAILRSEPAVGGGLALRMTDLLAPIGTCVDGDPEPRFSFLAEGEVCARLGLHAFCALPFDGCAPLGPHGGPGRGDGPDPMPGEAQEEEDADDGDDAEQSVVMQRLWLQLEELESASGSRAGSRVVTLLPRTRPLREVPPPDGPVLARVELVGRYRTQFFELGARQLEGSIILGRYERCLAGGDVFSHHVSRMHLAMSMTPAGLEVIDVASTRGVVVDGEFVFRVTVRDCAELVLSPDTGELVRIHVNPRTGAGPALDAR